PGRSVVVLEAGRRVETSDFTGDEGEMTARLWKTGLAGNSLTLYAGACVGGSTVINDAVCFRPPGRLLEVWQDEAQDRVLADLAHSHLETKRALYGGVRALALSAFYVRRRRACSAAIPGRSGSARSRSPTASNPDGARPPSQGLLRCAPRGSSAQGRRPLRDSLRDVVDDLVGRDADLGAGVSVAYGHGLVAHRLAVDRDAE